MAHKECDVIVVNFVNTERTTVIKRTTPHLNCISHQQQRNKIHAIKQLKCVVFGS